MASITFRKVGRLMSELGFRRGSGRAFRDFTYHNQNNPQVRHTVRFPPGKNRFTKEEIQEIIGKQSGIIGFDARKFCEERYCSSEIELMFLVRDA